MKRIAKSLVALGLSLLAPMALGADLTEGMTAGKLAMKSMGPLAFGPDGVLFAADTKAAAIYAIATGDTKAAAASTSSLKVEGINNKLAALLGTAADQILINDMAVNPVSQNTYLAVSRGRSADAIPVLVKVTPDGKLEVVSLDNVKSSHADLVDAPADAAPAGRGGNQRLESITDIAYLQDRVVIAGLSNEEFSSSFRSIPFPFKGAVKGTGVEMYHGAHGRFETRSPVRTFVSYTVGQEAALLAAYTCTPLVEIPVKDLTPGGKVKGKTIAEFGAGNRPLDMIVYQKGGKDYLLLSNSARGVMKVSTDEISKAASITEPVQGTKGLAFETIQSWTGIDQLDRLDAQHAMVVRKDGANINLEAMTLP